jgi:hypothetical protein
VKKQIINHKLTLYPIRLYILDAVYEWQLNEQIKQQVFAEQDKALQLLRLETGFSRKRCLEILKGTKSLDDFPCRPGYNTERRNINEL